MKKEDFDKVVKIDGWIHKEGPADVPRAKFTYQSTYISPRGNIMMVACYTYPDKYVAKVIYRIGGQHDIDFPSEEDAYDLLYRFIYEPDSVKFYEDGKEVSEQEFLDNTEKHKKSLFDIFKKKADNKVIDNKPKTEEEKIIEAQIKTIKDLNIDLTDKIKYKMVTRSALTTIFLISGLSQFCQEVTPVSA